MNFIDFEMLLEEHVFNDEEFFNYLEKNPISEIEFRIQDKAILENNTEFRVVETSVLEYIEELCSYEQRSFVEKRDEKIAKELKKVLYYSFFYLKEGISYMDLVQEGILGLIKGVDFGSDFLDAWIIREIFLKVKSEIQDLKFELKNFLKTKREEIENNEEVSHSDEQTHACSCGHEAGKEHTCCGKHHHEKSQEKLKQNFKYETLGKNALFSQLLKSNFAIDEMEQIIEETLDYHKMKHRLYFIEMEVLNYYFGLLVEKRHSIFEIERKLQLEKNHGQNIFENALCKLSIIKGKIQL